METVSLRLSDHNRTYLRTKESITSTSGLRTLHSILQIKGGVVWGYNMGAIFQNDFGYIRYLLYRLVVGTNVFTQLVQSGDGVFVCD